MARLRTIKPEFFANEDLAELSPHTRLLFIGLWTLADRRGILEDRPKRIKAALFPYEDADVGGMLGELARHGFIRRYEAAGIRAILIPTFCKHQYPHVNEKPSTVPEPEQHDASTVPEPEENDESIAPIGNLYIDIGVQGVDNGQSRDCVIETDATDPDDQSSKSPKYARAFEDFWSQYPPGQGTKKTTYTHWQRLSTGERAGLLAALERWKSCQRWQQGYVKSAELWIRDRLWEQDPPPPKPDLFGSSPNGKRLNRDGSEYVDFAAMAAELKAQGR